MRHRMVFLLGSVVLGVGGAFGLACSGRAAGTEGGPCFANGSCNAGLACVNNRCELSDGGTMPDGDLPDTVQPDSGNQDTGVTPPCPSYPVKGDCDMVTQNCPGGKECKVAKLMDGGYMTICDDPGAGSIPKGGACSGPGDTNCVKGTQCVQMRCAPPCCEGSDQACGKSVPEGFLGTCTVNLVDSQMNIIGRYCTFAKSCQPFKIMPCGVNETCLVVDMAGTAKCSQIFMPPGLMEGQMCSAANACADGLYCLGNPGMCKWVCYKGGGPFQDSIKTLPAGQGGCPMGKTCGGGIQNLPTWLGICQ